MAFAKCTGQQVAVDGTHSSQSAGNEESIPRPKQCPRQHVLDMTRRIDSKGFFIRSSATYSSILYINTCTVCILSVPREKEVPFPFYTKRC